MKILDRYISATLIKTTLLALAALLSLFTFLALIDELEETGRGSYTMIKAIEYVLLTLPRITYELFPIAAVIGSMTTLGLLAHNSELVVIRTAGVSLYRLAYSMAKGGFIIVISAILIGELLAPYCEQTAQQLRSVALSDQITLKTKNGFWSRDGSSFINIRKLLPGNRLEDIYIYEFDENDELRTSTYAKSARYVDDQWLLEDIKQSVITPERVTRNEIKLAAWNSLLNPDVINLVTIKPQYLTMFGLFEYIKYLKNNNQNSHQYEQALWSKIVTPFTIIILVLLAVPMVKTYSRMVAVSQRVFVGCFIGIGFHILDQVSSQMGVVYSINSFVSAAVPTMAVIVIVFTMMYKSE